LVAAGADRLDRGLGHGGGRGIVGEALPEVQRSVPEGERGHAGDHARVRLAVAQQAGSGGGTGLGAGGVHVLEAVRHRRGGAIHRAGGPDILAECRQLRETSLPDGLPAGQAVTTTAGRLPARWVIHTVRPVHSTREDRSATLSSCYRESLRVAAEIGARTVA